MWLLEPSASLAARFIAGWLVLIPACAIADEVFGKPVLVGAFIGGYLLLFVPYALVINAQRAHHRFALRRQREGFCPGCDYNLHGAEGPACPECGLKRGANDVPRGVQQRLAK